MGLNNSRFYSKFVLPSGFEIVLQRPIIQQKIVEVTFLRFVITIQKGTNVAMKESGTQRRIQNPAKQLR